MNCAEPPKIAMASAYIVPKPIERTDLGSVSVTAVRTATAAICTPILSTPVTIYSEATLRISTRMRKQGMTRASSAPTAHSITGLRPKRSHNVPDKRRSERESQSVDQDRAECELRRQIQALLRKRVHVAERIGRYRHRPEYEKTERRNAPRFQRRRRERSHAVGLFQRFWQLTANVHTDRNDRRTERNATRHPHACNDSAVNRLVKMNVTTPAVRIATPCEAC